MATVTAGNPRLAQQLAALNRANQVRNDVRAVRRDIKAGRITVAQALEDSRAQSATILALLMAQPRFGRARALRLLSPHFISESRRIRDLTDRQRAIIVRSLS